MHQSEDNKIIPMTSVSSHHGVEVTADVFYYTNQIVNLVMVGDPSSGSWVLIDAGMPHSGKEIIKVAEERFGKGKPPLAILLTHGHFDHVGSLVHLLEAWPVPVYVHHLEFPFLTGQSAYPEPDPSVQGGLLAKISSIYPHKPIDVTEVLKTLPVDGQVPHLPYWRWIHVPGHTPGQVAFFRESDRLLISADALVTVKQDSLYKVLLQKKEVNGPPRYFTNDWDAARRSAQVLRDLSPEVMIAGHGTYMAGTELKEGLDVLISNFDTMAIPEYGRYVDRKQ